MCGCQNQSELNEIKGTRPVVAAALTVGCMRMLSLDAPLDQNGPILKST